MIVKRCILCDCILTAANDSAEHIIPNAIGGRKRVSGFMCRACNSATGSEWDDELAKQVNPLSLYLGISRQRGTVPSQTFQTATGGSVRVNADGTMAIGKPEIDMSEGEDATTIHISVRNMKELRQHLKGLRRKYPKLNDYSLEDLLLTAQRNSHYSSDPLGISFDFGKGDAARSLVKMAVALAFDAGADPRQCDLALDYLLDDEKESCFGYYYVPGKDLVTNRPVKLPFHCVYVLARSSDSILLGYIEIYGLWRIVLCLSETYGGPDFSHAYSIDPVKGKELDITVNLDLSVSDIREIIEHGQVDADTYMAAIRDVFDTVRKIDFNRAKERVVRNAVYTAFAKSGAQEGDMLSDEQQQQLFSDIVEEITPFIIHNFVLPSDLESEIDER